MERNKLVKALKRLKVETGSLACLGCGYEHGCSVHGCAILREAETLIENQTVEIKALRGAAYSLKAALNAIERDFRTAAGGWDECEFCAHCCIDEKPEYRPDEKYLEYCNQCVDGSCFEWRGVMPGKSRNGKTNREGLRAPGRRAGGALFGGLPVLLQLQLVRGFQRRLLQRGQRKRGRFHGPGGLLRRI